MSIQIAFLDRYKVSHPAAYVVLESGSWKRGDGAFAINYAVYASKAALDAGGEPVHRASISVPYDSSTMTAGIEQYIMAHDAAISAGSPTQVA
jgi:hypothetical protein